MMTTLMASTQTSSIALQNEIAKTVDAHAPARRNERSGVELLDDGGAVQLGADSEARALIKCRLHRRAVERDASLAFHRLRGCGPRRRFLARLVFGNAHAQPQAIAHHFHRPLLGRVAVNLRMALVESLAHSNERRSGQSPGKQILERGAQLVTLTGIAQIELARKAAS